MTKASPSVRREPADHAAPPAHADLAVASSSYRVPALVLLGFGLWWFIGAALLHTAALVKLHAPELLAAWPWFTYGRLQPAAWNALVFGFCVPAGMVVAAVVCAQSARAPLLGGRGMIVAGLFWNIGLAIGLVGILAGDSTGTPALELPRYVAPIMFAACAVLAACPLISFFWCFREQGPLVLLYCLGSFFVLPWFYGAGLFATVFLPMRGVLQASAQAWFVHGLTVVWCGLTGLGVLFHLVPQASGVPLPSRAAAVFSFWTLIVFGGLGALQRLQGGPFPAWMSATGTAASVLSVLAVCGTLLNFVLMLRGSRRGGARFGARPYVIAAISFFSAAMVVQALSSLPAVGFLVQFTPLQTAIETALLVGFLTVTVLGAVMESGPELVGAGGPWPRWRRGQFASVLLGVVLVVGGLGVGGVRMGLAWNNSAMTAYDVSRQQIPFVGVTVMGWLLLWVAGLIAGANAVCVLVYRWRRVWRPAIAGWVKDTSRSEEVGA